MMDFKALGEKFQAHPLSPDIILPNVKVLDSASRLSPAFNDPFYLPFYYRLGCEVKPEKVVQIGSKLGLVGAAFLRGCPVVQRWHVVEESGTPTRTIQSNLRMKSQVEVTFQFLDQNTPNLGKQAEFKADVCFLTEKYTPEKQKMYLDFLWNSLSDEGLLVVDYIHDDTLRESFDSFCRVKNREPVIYKTRYGIAILVR